MRKIFPSLTLLFLLTIPTPTLSQPNDPNPKTHITTLIYQGNFSITQKTLHIPFIQDFPDTGLLKLHIQLDHFNRIEKIIGKIMLEDYSDKKLMTFSTEDLQNEVISPKNSLKYSQDQLKVSLVDQTMFLGILPVEF